jgi:hypothetical protein
MRLIKIKPLSEEELATMAVSAPEYRDLQQIERAVRITLPPLADSSPVSPVSWDTVKRARDSGHLHMKQ